MNKPLIKSRARVKERGEVFTPDWLVRDMLDALPADTFQPGKTWLEPACGDGRFLVAILLRKLDALPDDASVVDRLSCLASLYGVDIAADNVTEARANMLAAMGAMDGLAKDCANRILKGNIVCGDFLNPGDLEMTQWTAYGNFFVSRPFRLADVMRKPR